MPFERIIKNKRHQESIFRLMAYLMLSFAVLLYYFSLPLNVQHYVVFLFFAIVFLINQFLYHFAKQWTVEQVRPTIFILDLAVVAAALAATHCSLVFCGLALICIFYVSTVYKIDYINFSIAALIAIFVFYLSGYFFYGFDYYFNQGSSLLTIYSLACFGLCIGLLHYYNRMQIQELISTKNYYQEQMNRYVMFANQLSRYAPLQLWQSIMRGDTQAKIDYKRKKMTVFFADVIGFTQLAEKLIPDDLAFVLNDYLSHMAGIAKRYEGTLDKFIGDGMLIFFGDPQSSGVEQDAKNCVEMALAMRQQMHFLRERWLKMGFPELHIRMGVSTGYCHVGNYGSDDRMSYTLIGHDVNLAARLQAAASPDEILISDSTYKLIKHDFICVPKEPMQLKGLSEAIDTWQIMDKYTGVYSDLQQWFDYEYKGFHLLLNLEEVQHYEYQQLIDVLEKMIVRIQQQQAFTEGTEQLYLTEDNIQNEDQ
ncbi:adenylate/guanylate cyclase domain-containing protein [Acinetobacter sp. MD2]|uniref:adenylate/guanylate cyclase domain-containing protein n=1 Tax=Acinetobacter sp. MD2 TaxID=2600066 RepID=UPI002D1E6DDA|nr:adenylate/guanylate cyclase domain-containing protein [Acinetobacter sp. MD2]MEB3766552.1 adenylate/guanylate cyclase domain-containing protein [Acinetobacter sp. MD2]